MMIRAVLVFLLVMMILALVSGPGFRRLVFRVLRMLRGRR